MCCEARRAWKGAQLSYGSHSAEGWLGEGRSRLWLREGSPVGPAPPPLMGWAWPNPQGTQYLPWPGDGNTHYTPDWQCGRRWVYPGWCPRCLLEVLEEGAAWERRKAEMGMGPGRTVAHGLLRAGAGWPGVSCPAGACPGAVHPRASICPCPQGVLWFQGHWKNPVQEAGTIWLPPRSWPQTAGGAGCIVGGLELSGTSRCPSRGLLCATVQGRGGGCWPGEMALGR